MTDVLSNEYDILKNLEREDVYKKVFRIDSQINSLHSPWGMLALLLHRNSP